MTIKLVALLSFYDEQPAQLDRMTRSLQRAGVTDLVALDGAYGLYPDGKPASPPEQHQALREAADAANVRLHLSIPCEIWQGNEIEKRTRLFQLAEQHTTEHDWYMVIDADEHIHRAPADLLTRLADSWFDVADVTLREQGRSLQFPMLFRAIRGLHCAANHYTYRTPDGRLLWGNARTMRLQPRLPCRDMYVRHEPQDRAAARTKARNAYYQHRDQAGIEQHRLPATA